MNPSARPLTSSYTKANSFSPTEHSGIMMLLLTSWLLLTKGNWCPVFSDIVQIPMCFVWVMIVGREVVGGAWLYHVISPRVSLGLHSGQTDLRADYFGPLNGFREWLMPRDAGFSLVSHLDKDNVQVSRDTEGTSLTRGRLSLDPMITLDFGTVLLLRVLFSAENSSSKLECPLVVFNPTFRSFCEIYCFFKKGSLLYYLMRMACLTKNQKLVLFVLGLEDHQRRRRKWCLGTSNHADFLIRLTCLLIDWLIYWEPLYKALVRKWGYREGLDVDSALKDLLFSTAGKA